MKMCKTVLGMRWHKRAVFYRLSWNVCEVKKQKAEIQLLGIIIYGEGFVSKRRLFDLPECRDCIYKGSSYCWNQCPYNIWKEYR